jgi:prevent-host-death family protein
MTAPDLEHMNLTDARTGIAKAARYASRTGEPTILTDRGEELAAVISIEDFRQFRRLEREALLTELRRRQRAMDDGAGVNHDEVLSSLDVTS